VGEVDDTCPLIGQHQTQRYTRDDRTLTQSSQRDSPIDLHALPVGPAGATSCDPVVFGHLTPQGAAPIMVGNNFGSMWTSRY
jgi:hypothetical protein